MALMYIKHIFPKTPRVAHYPTIDGRAVEQQLGYEQRKRIIIFCATPQDAHNLLEDERAGNWIIVNHSFEPLVEGLSGLIKGTIEYVKYSSS